MTEIRFILSIVEFAVCDSVRGPQTISTVPLN